MNTLLTLSLGAMALSGTATTPASTDPLLIGLLSKLDDNAQAKNVSVTTLYAITGDPTKPKALGGFEMHWQNPTSGLRFGLVVDKIDSYTASSGRYYFKGRGAFVPQRGRPLEVQIEWAMQDNKKSGDAADAPGDSFAVHFYRPNSDLNVSMDWGGNAFTAVEIYKPAN